MNSFALKTDSSENFYEFLLSKFSTLQVMLDDHILKAQTMHSSAYIKPFEEEMKEWEDKLISMQDILDAWLRCQESWLYLEPIFNSEDIMKQMPVEGRKFNKVLLSIINP